MYGSFSLWGRACMNLNLFGKKGDMKLKTYGHIRQNWSVSLSPYALTHNGKSYFFIIPFYTFYNSTEGNFVVEVAGKTFDCLDANRDGESLYTQKVKSNQLTGILKIKPLDKS